MLYSQLDEQTQSENDSNNLEEQDDKKDGENEEQGDGFKRCCISNTDPDARLSKKYGQQILGYKDHRVVDDQCGIITASITTAANVTDDKLLKEAVETHCANTDTDPRTVVADKAYGTIENYIYLHRHDITPCISHKVYRSEDQELFSREQFVYDRKLDRYICPANKILKRRQIDRDGQAVRYCIDRSVCQKCRYFKECTDSEKYGRSIRRKFGTEYMEWADTCLSKRQRRRLTTRRQTKSEGSFADAVNNHGFKRARWRGIIKMQMQNLMIAAIQNLRKLLHHLGNSGLPAVKQALNAAIFDTVAVIICFTHRLLRDCRKYASEYPLFKELCRIAF
jgi:IS5 family transposase